MSEGALHLLLEVINHVVRYKGENGAGEAASVYTGGTASAKKLSCKLKRKSNLLVIRIATDDHILKKSPG